MDKATKAIYKLKWSIKLTTMKAEKEVQMNRKQENKQKTNSKMTDLILAISLATLNVNILHTPMKRQRLSATEID